MSIYICQKCKLPLVIDESLEELSNAQKNLLTINYGQRPRSSLMNNQQKSDKQPAVKLDNEGAVAQNDFLQVFDDNTTIPDERMNMFQDALHSSEGKPLIKQRKSENINVDDSSFILLEENHQESDTLRSANELFSSKTTVSERVTSLDNIFNIVSSKYEIDYPVCNECANTLIDQMKAKFEKLSREKDTYMQFLKKLTVQNGPNLEKSKESLKELEELNEKENNLLKELENEEVVQKELYNELENIEKELEELKVQEKQYCDKKNKYELDIYQQMGELDRVKSCYDFNLNQLDSLRKTNVFNDIFYISYDGPFGTINGLRLGTLPNVKVTWHEINAALGQVILLLSTCLNILHLDLEEYKLIPMGSTSKIEKLEKDASGKQTSIVFQLYSTGEFSIGGIFTHNALDGGMVALLDVILQVGQELKSLDETNDLPYSIVKDKVAGYNIKPSARGSSEGWTSACKYLLIDVNWILSYCIARYISQS